MKLNNKQKQTAINLFKEGYYFRPCIYDNGSIYELTKDLNPSGDPKPISQRIIYAEFNKNTAISIAKLFGFKIKNKTNYFGKCNPVGNGLMRYYVNNCVENLLPQTN